MKERISRRDFLKATGGVAIGLVSLKQLGCGESGENGQFKPEDITPIPPEQKEQLIANFQTAVFELLTEGQRYQFQQILKTYNKMSGENITVEDVQKYTQEELVELSVKLEKLDTDSTLKPEDWKMFIEGRLPFLADGPSSTPGEYFFGIHSEVRTGDKPMTIILTAFYTPEELRETRSFPLLIQVTTEASLDYQYQEDEGKYEIKPKRTENSKTFLLPIGFVIEKPRTPLPTNPPQDGDMSLWLYRQFSPVITESFEFSTLNPGELNVTFDNEFKEQRPVSLQELNSIIAELRQANETLEAEVGNKIQ